MRTTVRLNDELLIAAKKFAAESRLTLTEVLDQALRAHLARASEQVRRQPTPLPTFRGRGLQPGVDLDDSASLLDLMERGDDPA